MPTRTCVSVSSRRCPTISVSPKGSTPGEECQACVHYDENASSCEVVAGRISPHYVSDWFEAKDAAKAQPAQQDQPE